MMVLKDLLLLLIEEKRMSLFCLDLPTYTISLVNSLTPSSAIFMDMPMLVLLSNVSQSALLLSELLIAEVLNLVSLVLFLSQEIQIRDG